MHSIVTTEGIVLSKRSAGEANTRITILTRDLGVVRVTARSARLERSKLRYGLETFTHGRFALVEGRYDWKLTGTHDLSRPLLAPTLPARRTAARAVRLLLRLVQGEEPVPALYEVAHEGFLFLATCVERDVELAESIFVLRVLSELGYVEGGGRVGEFLEEAGYSEALLARAAAKKPALIRTINESLGATGL